MSPFEHALPIWHPAASEPNHYVEFCFTVPVRDSASCRMYLHVNTTYALYINGNLADCGSYGDFPEAPVYDTLSLEDFVAPGDNAFRLQAYYQGEDSFTVIDYPPSALFSIWEKDAAFGEDGPLRSLLFSGPGIPVRRLPRYAGDVPRITPQLSFTFHYDARGPEGGLVPAVCAPHRVPEMSAFIPRPIRKLTLLPPLPSHPVLAGSVVPPAASKEDGSSGQPGMPSASSLPIQPSLSPAEQMQLSSRSLHAVTMREGMRTLPDSTGISLSCNDLILDLGSEMAGFFLLDMEVSAPTRIYVGWGEHLDDGFVRTAVGGRCFTSVLTLPAGRTRFLHPFKRIAGRYVELHIYPITSAEKISSVTKQISGEENNSDPSSGETPCDVKLYYAGLRPVYYPLQEVNLLKTENPKADRIYEVSLRTLLLCMHEHYEDCPWREQALYTMDSRNQMLMGYYAFEEYTFPAASLRLIALGLREDNYLELINPGKAPITIPSFTAIFLIQAGEYLTYSKDKQLLTELLPALRRIARGWVNRLDSTGLIPRETDLNYWNFYEWQTGLEGHSHPFPAEHGKNNQAGATGSRARAIEPANIYDAPLQGFVSLGLKAMAAIESALGYDDLSREWTRAEESIRAAFHETFFDPATGCYRSFFSEGRRAHLCELTQALALCADLVPYPLKDSVRRVLTCGLPAMEISEPLYPITLSHSIFKYEALMEDAATYGSFVFKDISRQYGFMLDQGATSFWETIDGGFAFEKAGSLCHGWSAVPIYIYLRYGADLKKEGTALLPAITGLGSISVQKKTAPGEYILGL